MAGTLGKLNPFRYRGYVYDEETGLYYLRNRYYDPELQRFINTDFDISGDLDPLSHNIYTYALNDPINRTDEDGAWSLPNWAKVAIGTALVVAAAAVSVATAGAAAGPAIVAVHCFATGAAIGAAKGAISGAVGGAVTGVISNRIRTGSWKGSVQAAVNGAADGYLGGAIGGFITGGLTSKACFVAGTLVSAECGMVPIEQIRANQLVWAEDPETGERALKPVVRTFVNEKDELVHVHVNGETITCTTEHPFYVHGKGWVTAQRLVAGNKIELQSGEDAYVDAVEHEKLAVPIQVYNFEVEEFHTYYVGGACVLVHNRCLLGRRLTSIEPDPGSGYHAHHVFPAHLRSKFSQIGINVDEGRFGAWVKAGPHLKFSRAYNQAWKSFFNNGPTREGALALGRQLAQRHGYRIHF